MLFGESGVFLERYSRLLIDESLTQFAFDRWIHESGRVYQPSWCIPRGRRFAGRTARQISCLPRRATLNYLSGCCQTWSLTVSECHPMGVPMTTRWHPSALMVTHSRPILAPRKGRTKDTIQPQPWAIGQEERGVVRPRRKSKARHGSRRNPLSSVVWTKGILVDETFDMATATSPRPRRLAYQ